jgi:uncharacterized membrane protein YgcG
MLSAHLTARSARPIAAFLIMGSLMGFVAGQRLGHPAPVARHPVALHTTATAQHASGALGTLVVHTLAQPVPAAHPAASASDHEGDGHHSHDKHDQNGGSSDGKGGGDNGGGGGGDGGGGGN